MSVFISYRRDGGKAVAETIYRELTKDYDIFLDTESLKSGYFDVALTKRLEESSDFVFLATEKVFERCKENGDWILRELQIALKNGLNIIPVFVDTDRFPENIPETLKDIDRSNGIIWEDESTCEKIKTFFRSNRKHTLSIIRQADKAVLSEPSKQELIELYKRTYYKGERAVDIKIEIEDKDDFSELNFDFYYKNGYGFDVSKRISKQDLLKRLFYNKEIIESAVEFMIQDEGLDCLARSLEGRYIEKYSVCNCFITDENGMDIPLWTPFLWLDIIEEILKELVYDRYYVRGNSGDYADIDCYVESLGGKRICNFVSFINRNTAYGEKFIEHLQTNGFSSGKTDIFDVSKNELASNIYPDFFFYLGQLKNEKANCSFDDIKQYKEIFSLENYFFGAH